MTSSDTKLLEDALDGLDRLFDCDSSVADISALLAATRDALRTTEHEAAFERPIAQLDVIAKSGVPEEDKRVEALIATEKLRHYLAYAT
jgi:hypothetical protein